MWTENYGFEPSFAADAITSPESPNETAVAEVYPSVIGSHAMPGGPETHLQTALNTNDAFIIDIGGVEGILPGPDGVIQSVPCDVTAGCDDFFTEAWSDSCTTSGVVLLSKDELLILRKADVAHEVGHGFDIDHNVTTDCTSIMRDHYHWCQFRRRSPHSTSQNFACTGSIHE